MNLPDIALQTAYLRVSWTLVVSAAVLLAWGRIARTPASPARTAGVVGAVALLAHLPGTASFVHWLGLAFQAPSGLLTAWCTLILVAAARQRPREAFPPFAAWAMALCGTVLYVDTFGWSAFGLYGIGFNGSVASASAIALAAAAALAVAFSSERQFARAVLLALALHMVLRLPTGNLWDALLDPILWLIACGAAVGRLGAGRWRAKSPPSER